MSRREFYYVDQLTAPFTLPTALRTMVLLKMHQIQKQTAAAYRKLDEALRAAKCPTVNVADLSDIDQALLVQFDDARIAYQQAREAFDAIAAKVNEKFVNEDGGQFYTGSKPLSQRETVRRVLSVDEQKAADAIYREGCQMIDQNAKDARAKLAEVAQELVDVHIGNIKTKVPTETQAKFDAIEVR